MEQSLFIQYVKKYFPGITVSVVDKLNDTKNPLTYLHKRLLKKDFSVSGKWESISASNTAIMADVVSMDSSLPLKKRDRVSKANGDILKMGIELQLNERQLTDLDTLVAQSNSTNPQGTLNIILAKLFADTPRCITGIYERLEAMFLEGFSTGVAAVEDAENVGTGVRIDYGYPAANQFLTSIAWSSTSTAKPFDDIKAVLDKARLDGNIITKAYLDQSAIDAIAKTDQAKQLYAFQVGFVGSNVPIPSLEQINTLSSSRYGFSFEKVDRAVRYEKNGTQTIQTPWATGRIVFVTSDQIGSLVWARLAEMNHPVANVSYQNADDYILVSKYRRNTPALSEYTSAQARVVPVISNVDQIYTLDSTQVQQ